jgi:hypothetical protein
MTRVPSAKTWTELEDQFRTLSNRAHALLETANPARFLRQPRPLSWSAAECLAHLNLSADPYFLAWDREFERAPRLETAQEYHKMDFWGKVLYWSLEPPPRFRFSTTMPFRPVNVNSAEKVLPEFLQRQQRILETIQRARNFDVDRIKISSPFEARIRYSIWSSFCVTAAHERRHLWQAERALSQLDD